jgi:hypothetical protein
MSKTHVRVPLQGIGIIRDNKTVQPKIGEPFEFTQEELDAIVEVQERTGDILVRKVVNEEAGTGNGSTEITEEERKAAQARTGLNLLVAAAKDAKKALKDTPNSKPKKDVLEKAVNDLRIYANENSLEIPKEFQDTEGL